MAEKLTELEIIDQFHSFLMGLLPEGVTVGKMPKMRARQAFTVIWFLQEVSGIIPDHFELCDNCGYIFDSNSDGSYDEKTGTTFCSVSCEVEGLMPPERRRKSCR